MIAVADLLVHQHGLLVAGARLVFPPGPMQDDAERVERMGQDAGLVALGGHGDHPLQVRDRLRQRVDVGQGTDGEVRAGELQVPPVIGGFGVADGVPVVIDGRLHLLGRERQQAGQEVDPSQTPWPDGILGAERHGHPPPSLGVPPDAVPPHVGVGDDVAERRVVAARRQVLE